MKKYLIIFIRISINQTFYFYYIDTDEIYYIDRKKHIAQQNVNYLMV